MKGPNKPKWTRAFENEIERLFQGILDIEGIDTCFFIHNNEVTQDRKVTYSRIVCDIRPQKTKTRRVRFTVVGDKLSYDGPVSTPTEDLTTAKLHWNSILYIPDGKYLIVYFNNFYMENPMKKAKHIKIALKIILQEIIDKYDLLNKQCDR